jgi:uncharacterized protein with ParB-like and HNH nuclease domain
MFVGKLFRIVRVTVPANQREYSWTDREVTTLFQDWAEAIREGGEDCICSSSCPSFFMCVILHDLADSFTSVS